jgi:ketosteroid isomerase-like protein
MQSAPNVEQLSAAQVFTKLMSFVSTWEDLFAEQDYVLKLETREGQIVLYCVYENPMFVIDAFGES